MMSVLKLRPSRVGWVNLVYFGIGGVKRHEFWARRMALVKKDSAKVHDMCCKCDKVRVLDMKRR